MMKSALFGLSLPVLLAGCAGHLAENYSATRFDGYVDIDGKQFAVALHKSEPAFVTQVEAGAAISQAFAGSAGQGYPDGLHRQAAAGLLTRLSALQCTLGASRRIDTVTVEHSYSCRAGRLLTPSDVAAVTGQGLLTGR